MDKQQLKRRKRILRDISLGRFSFYIQPLEKVDRNHQACVEVVTYYQTYSTVRSITSIRSELEKDTAIVIFDLYVFEKICEVLKRWHQRCQQGIRFHISLSRVTLMQYDLDKQLEVIRNRYQVNAKDIGLIISYQEQEEERMNIADVIWQFRSLGYMMILDCEDSHHFDVLSYAMFSMVKLDLYHFVKSLESKRQLSYVYYMMKWLKEEHIEISFGGIMNEQQKQYVQSIGCSYMIAPYLQKAMPLEEFEELLIRQRLVNSYDVRGY